jgi:hypothetical protein
MSVQRAPGGGTSRKAADDPTAPAPPTSSRWAVAEDRERPAAAPPRSREEADARYVAARDAWTAAMHRASSGRSADLASLAIAQQAYEEATAERDRWQSGAPVAIPIVPEAERSSIDIVVGQEIAWRRVHESGQRPPSFLGRLARRITRRG